MQNINADLNSHSESEILNNYFDYEFDRFYYPEIDEIPNASIIEDEPSPFIAPIPRDTIVVEGEKNNSCFPFTKGKGIEKALEKVGLDCKFISPCEISLTKQNIPLKFKTTHYIVNKEGEIKKKKQRKKKPDLIRKKIKARFHKDIKKVINAKLKSAGSHKIFDYIPQEFVTNITVKVNKNALNLTYEKLLQTAYKYEQKNKKKIVFNPEMTDKYKINSDVLEYLESQPEICKNSEFDKIKKMKYKDILQAYFSSKEFEISLVDLYNKKNQKIEYIQEYINRALNYIDFFTSKKIRAPNSNI